MRKIMISPLSARRNIVMTHSSSINRVVGLVLFLLLGCTPLIFQVSAATAPVVSTLSSIKAGVSTPVRLAIDQWGDIYVTDPRGGGLNRFNNAGRLQKSIPVAKMPLGVAVASNGDILVSQGTTVKALDKSIGTLKAEFGSFKKANGITVDSSGVIYVVDSLDNCVQVFNADYTPRATGAPAAGKPVNSFGTTGHGDGQFQQPTGISYEKSSERQGTILHGRRYLAQYRWVVWVRPAQVYFTTVDCL
jgi:NHL repeat